MAKQNLSAVISIGATVMGSVVQSFNVVDKRLNTVTKEIGAVVNKQREMEKQRIVLDKEGKSVDALDREYQGLGRTLEELERRRDRVRDLSDRIGRVGTAFSGVARTVTWQAGVAGAAVTGLYTTMAALSVKVAGNIEETNRWAKRIGVTPEMFSKVAYAVKPFGVELDDLADGWKELTLRADEFAKTGKGSGEEAFQRLGLTPAQLKKLQKDPAALWVEIQKRASKIVDPSALQRIADELFGGTAAEKIIEYLKLTQDQIRAKDAEADRAGVTVTEEMAERARRFTQEQGRLISVMEGSVRTVAVELMPVISDQFERSSAWLIDNRPKVQEFAQTLGGTADKIGPVVGEIFTGATKVVSVVGDIVLVTKDIVGGWENVGIAAGILFMTPTIRAVLKATGASLSLVRAIARIGRTMKTASSVAVAEVSGIGTAALNSAGQVETATSRMNKAIAGINTRAALGFFNTIGAVLNLPDAEDERQSVINANRASIQSVSDNLGLTWLHNQTLALRPYFGLGEPQSTTNEGQGTTPSIQARARGGSYRPGLLLTGEHGPELRFETRSGYIATNDQLRDLMRTVGEAGGRLRAISAAVLVGATAAAANPVAQWPNSPVAENQQAGTSAPVTSILAPTVVGNAYRPPEPVPPAAPIELSMPQVAMARDVERGGPEKVNAQPAAAPNIGPFNFTIHAAPGMDVQQIGREVMEQIQSSLRGALYDRGLS